jgi:hypothetical protein
LRFYFAYILKGYNENYPEGTVICYRRYNSPYAAKGFIAEMISMNVSEDKECFESRKVAKTVGLGYADFKNEDDYKERAIEVIKRKMKEVSIDEIRNNSAEHRC